jgi:hypothetical protein
VGLLLAGAVIDSSGVRARDTDAEHAPANLDAAVVQKITVRRFTQNPLITSESSATLGDNIGGPTVIRVPDWVDRPLGRYYMYFAHHMGSFIRMAYADAITGPWKIYEPGVLHARETAFSRPPPERVGIYYNHIASPEVFVDTRRKQVVMWFHGWWTNGEPWPAGSGEARAWMAQKGYTQRTQAAESSDGLHFEVREPITSAAYLRVFQYRGDFYGLGDVERGAGTEPGRLFRSGDSSSFELGPSPFRDGPYENRVRHVAIVTRGNLLSVFFTGVGDEPERVLLSTIDLTQDWNSWKATLPVDVLQPETAYECVDKPNARSRAGNAPGKVRQVRDPFVFEEGGKLFLFYSICGESGIAAAEVTLR